MRRQRWARRLVPPVLVTASILVGVGCGVVNPQLLGSVGGNTAASVTGTEGNIIIMVLNATPVTTQANVRVTKTNGGIVTLNIAVAAGDHEALVQNCDVDTIEVLQASYAGAAGAVVIPATVSPLRMGLTLQCGGVVLIQTTGTPPNVALGVQGLGS